MLLVLACNACMNTVLHQRDWRFALVAPVLAVLVVDSVITVLRGERKSVVATWITAFIASIAGGLYAPVVGGLAAIAIFLLRLLWSVTQRPLDSQLWIVRAIAMPLLLIFFARSAFPSQHTSSELISLLSDTPYRFDRNSWAWQRLEARDDAKTALDEAIADSKDRHRRLVLAEIHAALGGSSDARAPLCHSLDETLSPTDVDVRTRLGAICPQPRRSENEQPE